MLRGQRFPLALSVLPLAAVLALFSACDLLPSRSKTAFVGDSALSYLSLIQHLTLPTNSLV
jgi:hypothetical protein